MFILLYKNYISTYYYYIFEFFSIELLYLIQVMNMKQIININLNLYNYLANKIIIFFEKKLELTCFEKEKLYFGILTLIINIVKTSLILCISFILGSLKEVTIIMLIFFILRLTAAGLHAKSSLVCTLTTLFVYVGGAYLSVNLPVNSIITFIICIILALLLYKYSPADTENRPLLDKKIRKKLKIKTLITSLLLLIINFIFWNNKLLNLTMLAMLFQTISILPLTYKLLKRSYNNYEKYEE